MTFLLIKLYGDFVDIYIFIFYTFVLFSITLVIMKVKVKSLNHVQLFLTPWTVAYQAPMSMGFSRQEYWQCVAISLFTIFSYI